MCDGAQTRHLLEGSGLRAAAMDTAAQQGACEPLKEQRDVQERGAGETGTWL